MRQAFTLYRLCTVLILLACLLPCAQGQQKHPALPDSPQWSDRYQLIRKLAGDEAIRSEEKYKLGRIYIRQQELLTAIKNKLQQAKRYLKTGLDTNLVKKELEKTKGHLQVCREGVFIREGSIQTQRNLSVSSAILAELLARLSVTQSRLDREANDLIHFRDAIDSLSSDTTLYSFPNDSVRLVKYVKKMQIVAKEIGPADSAIDLAYNSIQELQNQVEMTVFELHSSIEEIERYQSGLFANNFKRELPNIWDPPLKYPSVKNIFRFSVDKEQLALGFYVKDNSSRFILMLVVFLLVTYFVLILKSELKKAGKFDPANSEQLLVLHPLLSAFIITTSVYQFLFWDPPFIVSFCIWILAAIFLAIIFRNYITSFWMRFWILMIGLCFLAGLDNMILQVSRMERIVLLVIAGSGALYGAYLLRCKHKAQLREKWILYFIGFMVACETCSLFLNCYGRFNFAKSLMVAGFSGLIIAIIFLWTIRFMNSSLKLVAEVYTRPDKKLFYIDFNKVGDRAPSIFYVLLIAGWFILVGRNFYGFRQLSAMVQTFINAERTIGDYSFTIKGGFLFLLIFAVSLLLSTIISYFTTDHDGHHAGNKNRKAGLGSWILLIRIMIISFGIFLAFAASGIPLDKLTIILGALSVGIGLGLQTLVSNLVSGLIIAFEKPVNVGDVIEMGGQTGTMKSIGFRSSVIAMADGAHVVVPNGDLLQEHITNWTLGKNMKRLKLIVSVAYGTDLKAAVAIIEKLLQENNHILPYPAAAVSPVAFNTSGIDLEILYWVGALAKAHETRGELMDAICNAFAAAGIEIPFPQQEIRIKNLPGNQ